MAQISEFYVGTKIHFSTKDGEFEGTIKSVSYRMKHIKLDYVKCLSNQKYLGKMSVFSYEICSFKELKSETDSNDIHASENAENTVLDKVNMLSESTDCVSPSNASKLSSQIIKENFESECRSRLEKLNLKMPVKSDKKASHSERKIRFVPAGMDC